jgi:hypothetical protein
VLLPEPRETENEDPALMLVLQRVDKLWMEQGRRVGEITREVYERKTEQPFPGFLTGLEAVEREAKAGFRLLG